MGYHQLRLEEICSSRGWPPPVYYVQGDQYFIATVMVCNQRFQGQSRSSQEEAKEKAAQKAIKSI